MRWPTTALVVALFSSFVAPVQSPDWLRPSALTAGTDTLDTFTTTGDGRREPDDGAWYLRRIQPVGDGRWDYTDDWYDSSGTLTAHQFVRTARGSLATEIESARALGDSAALFVGADHVTGWVVPGHGAPVRLLESPRAIDRHSGVVVLMALARARPADGAVFTFTAANLYGATPLAPVTDTARVVRHDTLRGRSGTIPVLVVQRGTTRYWIDAGTGALVAARGDAGPGRHWWHVRRGVEAPSP